MNSNTTVILVVMTVALCAAQSEGYVVDLLGPNEWVHVGDSTESTWPGSVGSSWAETFTLDASMITEDGLLAFEHIEADPDTDTVFINGVLIGKLTQSDGTLNVDPDIPSNWVSQQMVVPKSALQIGTNTIRAESGESFPGSSLPLDDFMLKNMTLVPEPATVLLLGLGTLGLLRRRRA